MMILHAGGLQPGSGRTDGGHRGFEASKRCLPKRTLLGVPSASQFSAPSCMQGDCSQAVGTLMAATEASRPALQEQAVAKRQRLERKPRTAQGWFFDAETWLSGTGTSAEAAPVFFEEEVRILPVSVAALAAAWHAVCRWGYQLPSLSW